MASALDALKMSSLLVELSPEEIKALWAVADQRTHSADDLIDVEGNVSDCFFILY